MTRFDFHDRFTTGLLAIAAIWPLAFLGCDGQVGGGDDTDAAPEQSDASSDVDASIDECMGQPVIDWYSDGDGDGYGDPAVSVQSCGQVLGYVTDSGDCDDTRSEINPAAREICGDALDNDCQGGDPCDLSMIAHWKFDEGDGTTADDATGNGHIARLVNTGWNGAGTAVDFNGTTGYVEVDHADDFLVDQGAVALWFRTRNEILDQGIWSKDSSDYDTGGHLTIRIDYDEVDATGNQLVVRLQDTVGDHYLSINSIEAFTWYHVVVTFGPNGMALWINGDMRDNNNYTGGLGASSGGVGNQEPLAMGASTHSSGNMTVEDTAQHLDGLIREVRVFDRSLIASEIVDIYDISSL